MKILFLLVSMLFLGGCTIICNSKDTTVNILSDYQKASSEIDIKKSTEIFKDKSIKDQTITDTGLF